MDSTFYWELFMETGAPEAFLLYRSCNRKLEEISKGGTVNWKESFQ